MKLEIEKICDGLEDLDAGETIHDFDLTGKLYLSFSDNGTDGLEFYCGPEISGNGVGGYVSDSVFTNAWLSDVLDEVVKASDDELLVSVGAAENFHVMEGPSLARNKWQTIGDIADAIREACKTAGVGLAYYREAGGEPVLFDDEEEAPVDPGGTITPPYEALLEGQARIRTKSRPHFYIYSLRGVSLPAFVPEQAKYDAIVFPPPSETKTEGAAENWVKLMSSLAQCELEAEYL